MVVSADVVAAGGAVRASVALRGVRPSAAELAAVRDDPAALTARMQPRRDSSRAVRETRSPTPER